MKQVIIGWVVGTVTYVVVLLVGAAALGATVRSSGEIPPTWLLLAVPPVLAAAAAVLAARPTSRPTPTFGLAVVAVPALVSVALGLVANAEASARADVPAGTLAATVLVPLGLMLAVGLSGGLWRRARWSDAAAAPSYEAVA